MSADDVTLTFTAAQLYEIKMGIQLRIKQLEKWGKMVAGPFDAQGIAEELEDCKAALAKVEPA
jgi:hypothetical protein